MIKETPRNIEELKKKANNKNSWGSAPVKRTIK